MFGICVLGYRVKGLGFSFRASGSRSRVKGEGTRVKGVGLTILHEGCRVPPEEKQHYMMYGDLGVRMQSLAGHCE